MEVGSTPPNLARESSILCYIDVQFKRQLLCQAIRCVVIFFLKHFNIHNRGVKLLSTKQAFLKVIKIGVLFIYNQFTTRQQCLSTESYTSTRFKTHVIILCRIAIVKQKKKIKSQGILPDTNNILTVVLK